MKLFNLRRKRQTLYLLFLMIVCGVVELLNLASIIPFLIVITDYQKILNINIFQNQFYIFNINFASQILLVTTLTFVFVSC